jgi:hypothetical protein
MNEKTDHNSGLRWSMLLHGHSLTNEEARKLEKMLLENNKNLFPQSVDTRG